MKRKIIKIFTCALALSSIVCSASAATDYGPFGPGIGNRQEFSPSSGFIRTHSTDVEYDILCWDTHAFGFLNYWEGELRGTNGYNIHDAYSDLTGYASDLPNAYKEFDEDDLTIGSSDADKIEEGEQYYAKLTTKKGPEFSSGVDLIFESEYGIWGEPIVTDGLPLGYQTYVTTLNTHTRYNIGWAM